ncbi:MAG: hypothetical protein GYB65_07240, partial [Chloroflexi bacterium]|nr:hypothetical protein [Chloroflexota bacterium]
GSILLAGAVAGLLGLGVLASSAAGPQMTPTATPFVDPVGCWRPPDDYTRVWVNGAQFNARTIAMLDHAQVLYSAQDGIIDLRLAITQGSYNAGGVAASFGTHDGGGAVDLSVRSRIDWSVLTSEIEPLIRALRIAGFAAWLRDENELYPGSAIHIHAIAIGDADLSEMARAQIDGYFGYLRGYNGLPQANGVPIPDRYGGPVLCQWMLDLGYRDMRALPNPYPTPGGTTMPIPPLP